MSCWSSYPLMPDVELERAANSKMQLYGKYGTVHACTGSIASVFLSFCVTLQPKDNEYYTGCPGDANGAASSVASMALLASAVALVLTSH